MFGNLRVKSCGLPTPEKTYYRATFCTACHAMHRFGGRWTSLTTNYDITLWLALAQALDEHPPRERKRPCTALPLHSVKVYDLRPEIQASAAALNFILIGAKLRDNVDDGHAAWRLAGAAFEGKREKAETFLSQRGFPIQLVRELPARQRNVEASPAPDLDSLSSPTREVLAASFSFLGDLLERHECREQLEQIGQALGGYLYLWDAVEDREEDFRRGCFNALQQTGLTSEQTRELLQIHLKSLELALRRLPLLRHRLLFEQLLGSLSGKVRSRFPPPETKAVFRRPHRAQAAYLRVQDCDCCECGCDSCCKLDCCPCDGDGCGLKCCDCDICCCCCGGKD